MPSLDKTDLPRWFALRTFSEVLIKRESNLKAF
jgi:hypothetical protein